MSQEVSKWLVSWVIAYLRDLQPTFIGVIIHLLSTMDIPVPFTLIPIDPKKIRWNQPKKMDFWGGSNDFQLKKRG